MTFEYTIGTIEYTVSTIEYTIGIIEYTIGTLVYLYSIQVYSVGYNGKTNLKIKILFLKQKFFFLFVLYEVRHFSSKNVWTS